jgi:hypothetical protein
MRELYEEKARRGNRHDHGYDEYIIRDDAVINIKVGINIITSNLGRLAEEASNVALSKI